MVPNNNVAVIIPFYKGLDWLIQAIDSVKNQIFEDWKIYLINDGSNEDLSQIQKMLPISKLQIINQENRGAAAARNVGIANSKEKYIAFLDSDDLWDVSKLDEQVRFLESNTEFLWCHCPYVRVDITGEKFLPTHTDFLQGNIFTKSLIRCTIATPSVLIKRTIVKENCFGFIEGLKAGEDTVLWLKILRKYPIGLVNKTLVKVRMRGKNAASDVHSQLVGRSAIFNFLKSIEIRGIKLNLIYFGYKYLELLLNLNLGNFFNRALYLPIWLYFRVLYIFL